MRPVALTSASVLPARESKVRLQETVVGIETAGDPNPDVKVIVTHGSLALINCHDDVTRHPSFGGSGPPFLAPSLSPTIEGAMVPVLIFRFYCRRSWLERWPHG